MTQERWIIEYHSPDPSRESTVAYDSRAEAVQAAIAYIESEVPNELEGSDWTDEDAPKLLNQCLKEIEEKKYDDAIRTWLEFQGEFTPQDTIAIGPSGRVSSSLYEFPAESAQDKAAPAMDEVLIKQVIEALEPFAGMMACPPFDDYGINQDDIDRAQHVLKLLKDGKPEAP